MKFKINIDRVQDIQGFGNRLKMMGYASRVLESECKGCYLVLDVSGVSMEGLGHLTIAVLEYDASIEEMVC